MAPVIFNFMPDTQGKKQTVLAENHFYICSPCEVKKCCSHMRIYICQIKSVRIGEYIGSVG